MSAIAQNQPFDRTDPAAQAARRRMIRFHLITEANTIEIPLFQRWICDRTI